jgi:hypothetical protein
MEYFEAYEEILSELQGMLETVIHGSVEHEPETVGGSVEELDRCTDFSDILDVVKSTVKDTLGESRSDIALGFQNLPLRVGAYHPVGSNWIVMNQRLLNEASDRLSSQREMNSFIFSIMLHEYLHALGYLNEYQVRRLVYEISRRTLGESHSATTMARVGPWEALINSAN